MARSHRHMGNISRGSPTQALGPLSRGWGDVASDLRAERAGFSAAECERCRPWRLPHRLQRKKARDQAAHHWCEFLKTAPESHV